VVPRVMDGAKPARRDDDGAKTGGVDGVCPHPSADRLRAELVGHRLPILPVCNPHLGSPQAERACHISPSVLASSLPPWPIRNLGPPLAHHAPHPSSRSCPGAPPWLSATVVDGGSARGAWPECVDHDPRSWVGRASRRRPSSALRYSRTRVARRFDHRQALVRQSWESHHHEHSRRPD
jgi:hypothetical protein